MFPHHIFSAVHFIVLIFSSPFHQLLHLCAYCRFIYVPAPHTARVIAEILHDALVEWYLEDKVSTLTVDNATTNDACIPILENLIGPSKLMLGGKLLHMRCCAHILNLIVKDGLDVLEESIEKIRDSVAFWTSTPKRIENFQEVAKMLKVDQSKKIIP